MNASAVTAHESQRRRIKAERPQQILEAAFEEFAQNGYAAARLEDVARRVGITKGTIYLYFESKVELFKAVVRAFTLPMFEEAEALVAQHVGSKAELLKAQIMEGYCDVIEDKRERELLRLLIAEGEKFPELTDFYHEEIMMRAERMTRSIVAAGIAQGEFRDSALARQPMVLFGPMVLYSVWRLLFGDRHPLDHKIYIEAHLDAVLKGILVQRDAADEKTDKPDSSPA